MPFCKTAIVACAHHDHVLFIVPRLAPSSKRKLPAIRACEQAVKWHHGELTVDAAAVVRLAAVALDFKF